MASHPVVHPLDIIPEGDEEEDVEAPPEAIQPPGVPMHELPGVPGTPLSCGLRVAQLILAGIAVSVMWSARGFSSVPAFIALIPAFTLQFLWSAGLAALDGYVLSVRCKLRRRQAVVLFAAGDMVFSWISLGAACAAAGMTVFMDMDLGLCHHEPCTSYKTAAAMGFLCFFTAAPTLALNMMLIL